MKLFIVLVLGFLTLGFYELSGGSDFDPVAAREAAVLARVQEAADKAPGPVKVAALPAREIAEPVARVQNAPESEATVTRASLNLTAFDAVANAAPLAAVTAEPKLEGLADEARPAAIVAQGVSLEVPGMAEGAEETGTIPSLVFEGKKLASTDVTDPQTVVRTVAGDLVNVRGGPGTGYRVVNQLKKDAMVEVIADNGAGWVQLRPVDGSPSGWMADFLLNDG
ncbi:SH3 domain-containing protein [uncultured Roseobacter sp.]|uniref:SH3 domain-containing protein n=1 Tax=uncultured Roseobacter sp. TaxID=114847 RepID=UPI0026018435|nr:SH3 domain-containing protein [uncultured Roseobacter sp.]